MEGDAHAKALQRRNSIPEIGELESSMDDLVTSLKARQPRAEPDAPMPRCSDVLVPGPTLTLALVPSAVSLCRIWSTPSRA